MGSQVPYSVRSDCWEHCGYGVHQRLAVRHLVHAGAPQCGQPVPMACAASPLGMCPGTHGWWVSRPPGWTCAAVVRASAQFSCCLALLGTVALVLRVFLCSRSCVPPWSPHPPFFETGSATAGSVIARWPPGLAVWCCRWNPEVRAC